MVNASAPASQAYTVQPSFVTGNEAKANTEKTQPRSAPAADSQRADQRTLASPDQKRAAQRDETESRQDAARSADEQAESRRGSQVDITV